MSEKYCNCGEEYNCEGDFAKLEEEIKLTNNALNCLLDNIEELKKLISFNEGEPDNTKPEEEAVNWNRFQINQRSLNNIKDRIGQATEDLEKIVGILK